MNLRALTHLNTEGNVIGENYAGSYTLSHLNGNNRLVHSVHADYYSGKQYRRLQAGEYPCGPIVASMVARSTIDYEASQK